MVSLKTSVPSRLCSLRRCALSFDSLRTVRCQRTAYRMSDNRKRLVERLYAEGMNRRDAAASAAFYALDATNHGRTVGREGMQRVFEALFSTFPDFHYRIDQVTAEDDRVVCKVTMTGTHRGQPLALPSAFGGMLTGVPPTGRKVEVLHFHSFRIGADEIAEHSAVRDDLGMCKQLGLIKPP
jgi:predicted ester cyclase